MYSSQKYKKFLFFVAIMRWAYGLLFISASLVALAHLHATSSYCTHPAVAAYDMCTTNLWVSMILIVIQFIVGLLLLVPKTALLGAYAGIGCFAYTIIRLWMKSAPFWPALGINIVLAVGLVVVAQLLSLQRLMHHR